jgi:hypothetical protein
MAWGHLHDQPVFVLGWQQHSGGLWNLMGIIVAGTADAFIEYGWYFFAGLAPAPQASPVLFACHPAAFAHSHEHSVKILTPGA